MRRSLNIGLLALFAAGSLSVAAPAFAQQRPTGPEADRRQEEDSARKKKRDQEWNQPAAPLPQLRNAGPCPYVKVLYDAARYVELTGDRVTMANVGFTGEIEGLVSDCAYQADQPITVHTRVLFNLGRGPQAQGDGRTYRYWIAVTERNRAVLAKEYFDLPVNFDGATSTTVTQDQTIVIPRAEATTSGDHFEVLVGFEVTPAMAEFNRNGNRFRANAGTGAAQPPAQ